MDTIYRDTTVLLGKAQEDLEHWLRQGHSRFSACKRAEVSYDTFCNWMIRGGDTNNRSQFQLSPYDIRVEPYHSFVQSIHAAERIGKSVGRPRGYPTGPPPSPLSTDQRTKILNGFRQGWHSREVASRAGVRHTTLLGWLHRGGYPNLKSAHLPLSPSFVIDPYKTFVEDVIRAEDEFFTG